MNFHFNAPATDAFWAQLSETTLFHAHPKRFARICLFSLFSFYFFSTAPLAGQDSDQDGVTVQAGDCNDNDPTVWSLKRYYRDADGDGFGGNQMTMACAATPPAGFAYNSADCNDSDPSIRTPRKFFVDADLDGFGSSNVVFLCSSTPPLGYATNSNDCNDNMPGIHKLRTYYPDNDDDGFGNGASPTTFCLTAPPEGFVYDRSDCDDADPTVHATKLFYVDADGDGFGSNTAVVLCKFITPPGYSLNNNDCNDNNPAIRTPKKYYVDADEDGYGGSEEAWLCQSTPMRGFSVYGNDCADDDENVNPGISEACDGTDQNCDGVVDDGQLVTFYADADGDGFGNVNVTTEGCTPPEGYVSDKFDCNDANANAHPGAAESCNGADDNCNWQIDENVQTAFYPDNDGDGFGATEGAQFACSVQDGFSANNLDCNDGSANVFPGSPEICNGTDENCNGQIDESAMTGFYRDADGDGFGDVSTLVSACEAPAGFVTDHTDCNDADGGVHPTAAETCNSVDENCNELVDEGVLSTYFPDSDSDSFGAASGAAQACSAPSGYVSENTDCNDGDGSIRPGATEICNGIDDNCSGSVDEGVQDTYFADVDGDGFGNPNNSSLGCAPTSGFVADNSDCNDAAANINPGADEICNNADDNCNGSVDEGVSNTYFADSDNDGYGNPANTTQSCALPVGYVSNNLDCNDANAAINPPATEICNGADENCNGSADEGVLNTYFYDADADAFGTPNSSIQACSAPSGYVANNTDCNDANADVNPQETEGCNGIDDNCNGLTDETCLPMPPANCTTVYRGYAPAACASLAAESDGGTAPFTYLWSNGQTVATILVCPTVQTTYTVTITDSNGATGSNSFEVNVIDVRCGNNLNKVYLCHTNNGQDNTLCVNSGSVPAHLDHGDYLGECGTQDPCDENRSSARTKSHAGHEHDFSENEIEIFAYPNPASGNEIHFIIENQSTGAAVAKVVNAVGQIVETRSFESLPLEAIRWDLSAYPAGVYFLQVEMQGASSETIRFSVERP